MHIGSGTKMPVSSDDAPVGVKNVLTNVNGMLSMADWLMSGDLVRFPNLKLLYAESQIGWIPFLLERADNVFRKELQLHRPRPARHRATQLLLSRSYLRLLLQGRKRFGLQSRKEIGVEQILFETDYPHQDTTWPDTLAYLEKVMAPLTSTEIHLVVRGNAERILGARLAVSAAVLPCPLRPFVTTGQGG